MLCFPGKDTALLGVGQHSWIPLSAVSVHGDLYRVAVDVLAENRTEITPRCTGFVGILIVHRVAGLVVLGVLGQQFRQDYVSLVPERLAASN